MTIASVTSRHTVTVLEQTETIGAEMGNYMTWAPASPARVLTCTVVPNSTNLQELLLQPGVLARYTVYFASDPHLDRTHKVIWDQVGVTLRTAGEPRNAHGQNRLWILPMEAHTSDNPTGELS